MLAPWEWQRKGVRNTTEIEIYPWGMTNIVSRDMISRIYLADH